MIKIKEVKKYSFEGDINELKKFIKSKMFNYTKAMIEVDMIEDYDQLTTDIALYRNLLNRINTFEDFEFLISKGEFCILGWEEMDEVMEDLIEYAND